MHGRRRNDARDTLAEEAVVFRRRQRRKKVMISGGVAGYVVVDVPTNANSEKFVEEDLLVAVIKVEDPKPVFRFRGEVVEEGRELFSSVLEWGGATYVVMTEAVDEVGFGPIVLEVPTPKHVFEPGDRELGVRVMMIDDGRGNAGGCWWR